MGCVKLADLELQN